MPQLVITATGPDRPGLVGEFTGHLFAGGANLADSRMVNLRGQFALIALVEGEEKALASLRSSLPGAAQKMGLVVTFAAQAGEARSSGAGVPFRLKTYSLDQPGIVHRVSDLLRRHQINIEDLQTRLESAPFDGTPLFTLEMQVSVPTGVQVKRLRTELEQLCETLNCDLDLEPA
jgi:glycine cleavage system transcriptional repressor